LDRCHSEDKNGHHCQEATGVILWEETIIVHGEGLEFSAKPRGEVKERDDAIKRKSV
jgi:hypothetical protein